MLTLAEEILLLTLDDDGHFIKLSPYSMELALAGAVLMELSLRDRIDTDLEQLMVLDAESTGDDILDPVLAKIDREPEQYSTRHWLKQLYQDIEPIRKRALERLVERGVLRQDEKKFLWVFGQRRYPTLDDKERQEARLRVLGVLFDDEIPDPRDILLICLAEACSIFRVILTRQEQRACAERIGKVTRMDLIGREMARMLQELHDNVLRDPLTD